MSYQPQFTITPALLGRVEVITALRERIQTAAVQVAWIPALQKDSRARNAHSSTAIEGNPLTLAEVRAVEANPELTMVESRARREVLNYFAALRHVEKHAAKKRLTQQDILRLHGIVAAQVMEQGDAGRYRTIRAKVGPYLPPPPEDVSGLMFELLDWWNKASTELSPVLSSAILHYRLRPFIRSRMGTDARAGCWRCGSFTGADSIRITSSR